MNNQGITNNDWPLDAFTLATETSAVMEYNGSLEDYLGPRHRSHPETVVWTVFYCVVFVTGVLGNVSTCVVIFKNGYMHTATNYYLFSLAVSDLLTLVIGLPPELYSIWEAYPWRLGEPYCQLKSFITEMTSCASVLTITAFTVERYVAICHPMRSHTMSNLSRAIKIIVLIWIMAGLIVLPVPLHVRTFYAITDPHPIDDSLICTVPRKWLTYRMNYYFAFSTIVLFLLPMTVITVLYILIGLTLRRSGLAHECAEVAGNGKAPRYKRTVIKMLGAIRARRLVRKLSSRIGRSKKPEVHLYLVAVVIAFFICWAPFHAQRLMTVFIVDPKRWTHLLLEIQSQLFYVSGILWFVGSTVNPILYNLMSRKYRQAFKHTLCRCCWKQHVASHGSNIYLRQFTSQPSETYLTTSGSSRVLTDRTYFSHSSDGDASMQRDNPRRIRDVQNNWKRMERSFNESDKMPNGCCEKEGSSSDSPIVILGTVDKVIELETLICEAQLTDGAGSLAGTDHVTQ